MSMSTALYPTGVPGLDAVLGGGLVPGSLVFLSGAPGAGKTVLASQIIFNSARQGTQVLIFTAFSEGSVKLVSHLNEFEFFDATLVGDTVTIFSLPSLLGDDPTVAAKRIVQAVRDKNARIVLMDGFQGIASMLGSQEMMRRTLAEIASLLSFLDIIVLVTLEAYGRNEAFGVALTTADTVIGMEYGVQDGRHVRHLDLIKQRGAAPLGGLHTYAIDGRGISVYPRIESLPVGPFPPFELGRAPFGLPELDTLLSGGLTARTTTILAGAPGVGKTTLGLFWSISHATPDQATLFVSFGEYPQQLQFKAAAFGLDLDGAIERGALRLLRLSPVDIIPDIVASKLIDALDTHISRVVIDDVAGLLYALGGRGGVFLSALAQICYQHGVTTMLLLEIEAMAGLRLNLANTSLSLVSENVILLQHIVAAGRLHRMLAVLKMRFSDYDQTLREVVMDKNGLRVLTPTQTGIDVLDEAAREGGGFSPNDVLATNDNL